MSSTRKRLDVDLAVAPRDYGQDPAVDGHLVDASLLELVLDVADSDIVTRRRVAAVDMYPAVQAAITRGPDHRIVLRWLESDPFELIICQAPLEEVATVLIDRDRLRRWISIQDARLYVHRLRTTADVQGDPVPGPSLTRDPGDDFIVYLVRENDADLIVSGDGESPRLARTTAASHETSRGFERVLSRN